MYKTFAMIFLICGSFILIKSQPAPLPNNRPQSSQPQRNDGPRRGTNLDAAFRFSNPIGLVAPLYRKPNKKELQAVSPTEDELNKYEEFLDAPKTGLFRLMPDIGCPQDTKIVNASETCLKYPLPGSGAAFSFRRKSYQFWRLSDMIYRNGQLSSVGVLQQGIFTDLGDVELEKVSLASDGMKYLNDYVPVVGLEEAKSASLKFRKGVTVDKYNYSSNMIAKVNSTYVFRSIAYRGSLYLSYRGITYNEFEFDERKDVIVAFRVIKKNDDGSLVILWKELSRKDSPKIRLEKDDRSKELKPNNFVAKN